MLVVYVCVRVYSCVSCRSSGTDVEHVDFVRFRFLCVVFIICELFFEALQGAIAKHKALLAEVKPETIESKAELDTLLAGLNAKYLEYKTGALRGISKALAGTNKDFSKMKKEITKAAEIEAKKASNQRDQQAARASYPNLCH